MSETETSATRRYVGRAWRSRFLRAPTRAHVLAARPDFIALGELADLALGLKTGNDDWFMVEIPDGIDGKLLRAGARGTVVVKGLSWEGVLSRGDLRAVLMSPRELLDRHGDRHLTVPARTHRAYVYPADRPRREGLQDYVDAGERNDVHRSRLVQNNGRPGRWDRQRRELIDSPWLVPYNSAYDYGAHDNAVRRVLNGRSVGVDPRLGVDGDLLGAVLNSTFAVATRLLEGVATGTEGAYDVGPPAARLMMVPDLRAFSVEGADRVRAVLRELRKSNVIPPAPDRTGRVVEIRRRLDLSILEALGLTAGHASAQIEELYVSYGRWRRSVEDVETRMRGYRRALSASGRQRTERPVELVAREIWDALSISAPRLPADELPADADLGAVAVAKEFSPARARSRLLAQAVSTCR